MKRIRLIVAEINITNQGQMKHFQIKLLKNTNRIIAVETDARMDSALSDGAGGTQIVIQPPVIQTL